MAFDKPIIQTSNPNKKEPANIVRNRTIFYGEVINNDDELEGGRLQVRIPELDNRTANGDLPWSYPLLPKFSHVYPQVGEMVRIFLEDNKFPERSRFWMGSIISQPQKIGYDSKFAALSTTNLGLTKPEKAPSTYPDADGVYPTKNDIAIVGKVNTDIILRLMRFILEQVSTKTVMSLNLILRIQQLLTCTLNQFRVVKTNIIVIQ